MSNKMLLWREFVCFFLILFRVLLLLGGKSYWERLKNETMWGKALSHIGVIYHVPPHTEKNNPNGVGAWFITFRNHKTMMNDDSNKNNGGEITHHTMERTWWAERDKSRPYGWRKSVFRENLSQSGVKYTHLGHFQANFFGNYKYDTTFYKYDTSYRYSYDNFAAE